MKRILITGANGQLGRALKKSMASSANLFMSDLEDLDITNLDAVMKEVKEVNPDFIINCAAYTNVEGCETNQDIAYSINAEGVKNISLAANEIDAVLFHISTDYVFDGNKKEAYVETDETNPKSVYGKSKLAGEKYVEKIAKKYFIIRTAWLYGDGKNFVRTMLQLAENNSQVKVVNDQIGSPTSTLEVVKVISLLLETDKYGIYHCTCEGACSWADFATEIFRLNNLKVEVLPVSTKEYPSVVDRPANSVLDNKKLRDDFKYTICDWKDAIRAYFNKENGVKNNPMDQNKKMKVLVTGANGYLGRHVVSKLLDMNHEVLASDFSFDGVDNRAIQVKEQIFSNEENIYEILGSPDVCIHLAWRNGFVHNADSHMLDLANHYEFIKKMIEGGLPQICVMGTMHEVGYFEGAIDDESPTNPTSLYGIAKNTLRQTMPILTKDQSTIVQWLRAYYIMGDDTKNNSIFSKIVTAEKEGKETFPFTSGKNQYDFINVEELAYQIAAVASQTEVDGVINCCTGKPVSLADKVSEFLAENNFRIRLNYGAFPDRPYDSPGVWGNAAKINKIISNIQK